MRIKRNLSGLGFLLGIILTISSCADHPDPQRIVDLALREHGAATLENAVVEFDFRGKRFEIERENGLFSYTRAYRDSTGSVQDVLTNEGIGRMVNGEQVPLTEPQRLTIEEVVNSVTYFALLPRSLNDPAVQKRYLGEATVEGEPYHMIEVTFQPEGGGRDHDDRFVYWFHRDEHTMDYLAYYFHAGMGGSRFRKAVNVREVGGVRFADYLNYTAEDVGMELERYAVLAGTDSLRLLSEVVLENVSVDPTS